MDASDFLLIAGGEDSRPRRPAFYDTPGVTLMAVSNATVGRILKSLVERGRVTPVPDLIRKVGRASTSKARPHAVRKPKTVSFGKPGDVVQIDTLTIMPSSGRTLNDAVNCLPPVFNPTAGELTSALKSGYGATEDQIAPMLNRLQYGAAEVADAIAQAFNRTPDEVNSCLQQAGYPADQVKNAFQNMGGDFRSAGEKISGTTEDIPGKVVNTIADKWNPTSW